TSPEGFSAMKAALVADLGRVAARDRWGLALMAIGWAHLAFFLVNQAVYTPDDSRAGLSLALWVAEVVAVLGIMRGMAGRGGCGAWPLAGVVVRVWGTFLILSFNVASLNSLTGWALDWFKPVWASLSTFGFATMAWLFGPRFLIVAVQMYVTGLLMV